MTAGGSENVWSKDVVYVGELRRARAYFMQKFKSDARKHKLKISRQKRFSSSSGQVLVNRMCAEMDFKIRKKHVILFLLSIFIVLLLIIGVPSLFQPKKEWFLSEEQKETVLSVGIAYVEENYGTDYFINGNVTIGTYTEGRTVYTYPTASFIVPADLRVTGVLVHIMVDPEIGKVVKVWTTTSHAPPTLNVDFLNQNMSVHQGGTASSNMTLTSTLYEEELNVSFSLDLGAYQNIPVASSEPSPFLVMFDPDPLVLKYQEPKTVILTITADEATPLGVYMTTINWSDKDKEVGMGATLWITVIG